MRISSPAFADGERIPIRFTIDGESSFIPLDFHDVPAAAVGLALIFDDPDVPVDRVPSGLFVHWLAWNIDPSVTGIAAESPAPGILGSNTRGTTEWVAPAPPPGDRPHRYIFTLYALDAAIDLPQGSTRDALLAAVTGHELAVASMIGYFSR